MSASLIYGRRAVAEALAAGSAIKGLVVSSGSSSSPAIRQIRSLAEGAGIGVEEKPRPLLDRMAPGANHQGVIALLGSEMHAPSLNSVIPGARRLLLLDGVTDPANLGSMLRSAEAFGWDALVAPRHRNASLTPAVRKVASGAAERIPLIQSGSAASTVLRLKAEGFQAIGLDPDGESPYAEAAYPERLCLVVGAEGAGLSQLVKRRCDTLLRIPMRGRLASLNVAVAAAIVMAEIAKAPTMKQLARARPSAAGVAQSGSASDL